MAFMRGSGLQPEEPTTDGSNPETKIASFSPIEGRRAPPRTFFDPFSTPMTTHAAGYQDLQGIKALGGSFGPGSQNRCFTAGLSHYSPVHARIPV